MRITRQVVVLDAANMAAVSQFWAGVLGGHVVEDDDWHSVVDSEGEWRMGVQFAPDHVAPDWPAGTPGQQLHLDLWGDDIDSAHAEVIALGAPGAAGARRDQRARPFPRLRGPGRTPVLPVLGGRFLMCALGSD